MNVLRVGTLLAMLTGLIAPMGAAEPHESKGGNSRPGPEVLAFPPGHVAFVLAGDQSSPEILPGKQADVQLYIDTNAKREKGSTEIWTVLKGVRVLAVNTAVRRDVEDASNDVRRTYTLLVAPQQAKRLTLAKEIGEVRLTKAGTAVEGVRDATSQVAFDKLAIGSVKSEVVSESRPARRGLLRRGRGRR